MRLVFPCGLLPFAMQEALPTTTVQSLIDFVIDAHAGLHREDVVGAFDATFANTLMPKQRQRLVAWYRRNNSV